MVSIVASITTIFSRSALFSSSREQHILQINGAAFSCNFWSSGVDKIDCTEDVITGCVCPDCPDNVVDDFFCSGVTDGAIFDPTDLIFGFGAAERSFDAII
jgi:hypothetical protein